MFTTIILVHVANIKKDNKSPATSIKEKEVKCEVVKSFSDNYYNARGRSIRKSKNVRINKYHADDVFDNDSRYILTKAVVGGLEYKVDRILNDKYPNKVILDLEEIK